MRKSNEERTRRGRRRPWQIQLFQPGRLTGNGLIEGADLRTRVTHGYEHVTRGTHFGTEHYFASSVFDVLRFL